MPGILEFTELDEMVVPPEDHEILDVYEVQRPTVCNRSVLLQESAINIDFKMLKPFIQSGKKPNFEQAKAFSHTGKIYLQFFECLQSED